MHVLMVIGTLVWLMLVGLLWYLRPGDVAWFAGSMVLGAAYFTAFFWYVTRSPMSRYACASRSGLAIP